MKQVVLLIIIILWSVLKARRKALREAKRLQAANLPLPASGVSSQAIPPGANEPAADSDESELPQEIQRLLQYSRQRNPVPAILQPAEPEPEVVETVVPAFETETATLAAPPDAYAITTSTRRRFVLDRDAVRTFVVTREILGPPRSRKPFRIAPKAQE